MPEVHSKGYTVTLEGAEDVAEALGELRKKTPAAVKVAINATAREARKLMIAKANARYAVNAAGQKHLKDLVQRKKASNTSLSAELYISSFRNDLGYFMYSPQGVHTGLDVFRNAPPEVRAKVLKASSMKPLLGEARLSKGFVLQFKSGHIGMVQRVEGSNSSRKKTARGYPRWTTKDGRVEKLRTMGSPSATAMHNTIWPEVRDQVEEFLMERLDTQIDKVLARAGKVRV